MQMPLRRGKLHMGVQLGDDSNSQLLAANDFRIDRSVAGEIWLLFNLQPSLRTGHKQEAMYRQAHAWAQAPASLKRLDMPGFAQDLSDIAQISGGDNTWWLRVEMGDYGAAAYRTRPEFAADQVIFHVVEHA